MENQRAKGGAGHDGTSLPSAPCQFDLSSGKVADADELTGWRSTQPVKTATSTLYFYLRYKPTMMIFRRQGSSGTAAVSDPATVCPLLAGRRFYAAHGSSGLESLQ